MKDTIFNCKNVSFGIFGFPTRDKIQTAEKFAFCWRAGAEVGEVGEV